MKVDMYIDVDANFLKHKQQYGVHATSLPMKLYTPSRRFKFTVDIPDDAVYGNVEYAPVTLKEEVVA